MMKKKIARFGQGTITPNYNRIEGGFGTKYDLDHY